MSEQNEIKPRLFEISAIVNYHVVVRAKTKEEALKHVETWEQAWPQNSDLVCVSDIQVFDVRDGLPCEANEDLYPEPEEEDGECDSE